MRILLITIALAMFQINFGQTLTQSISSLSIIGAKQVAEKVILLTLAEAHEIGLIALDAKGATSWKTSVNVSNLGGYNFNKVFILGDTNAVYLIQDLEKTTKISKYSYKNGQLIESYTLNLAQTETSNTYAIRNGKITQLLTDNSVLYDASEKETLFRLSDKYENSKLLAHYNSGGWAYLSSRVLDSDHGLMHLYLAKYNLATGDTIQKEVDLDLAHTSFTYNSSFDKQVYNVIPTQSGFYFVGKLDIAFKGSYPTTKVGDNCIGIWVAKFNQDLEMQFFSEIPFQFLNYIVPADVVNKPAVVDVLADLNGGLFININELQGVIYGNKYFVYLKADGSIGLAKGGHDEYNFMEYDKMGLRHAGRKDRIRLMNDEWPPYATNSFLYLTAKEQLYSDEVNRVLLMCERKNMNRTTKAYTFFKVGDKTLYLEYLDKKKGTLNVYSD